MDKKLLDYLTIGGDFQNEELSLEDRLEYCIQALNKAAMAYCLELWAEEKLGKKMDSDNLKAEMHFRSGYQAGLLMQIQQRQEKPENA